MDLTKNFRGKISKSFNTVYDRFVNHVNFKLMSDIGIGPWS